MASLHRKGVSWYAVFSVLNTEEDRKSKYKTIWKRLKSETKTEAKIERFESRSLVKDWISGYWSRARTELGVKRQKKAVNKTAVSSICFTLLLAKGALGSLGDDID